MKVTVPRQAPWPDNFIVGEQSFDADFEAIASVSELRLQRLRRPAWSQDQTLIRCRKPIN